MISLVISTFLFSCSSFKREKVINEDLSKDALTFYFSAEELRLRGRYKEAINLYDRAAALYISKLSYQDFCLTQLKKALVFTSIDKEKNAQEIVDRVSFWQKSFHLDIQKEIKGVLAKIYIKEGKNQDALNLINELLKVYNNDLLLKTYYMALSLEAGEDHPNILIEISGAFDSLYKTYQDKGTTNPDALVYIGKTLLKTQKKFSQDLVLRLENLSRELEIPTLSVFLLEHYRDHAPPNEKLYFEYLIREIARKEKGAILL